MDTVTQEGLLNCPCCGGNADYDVDPAPGGIFSIWCSKCSLSIDHCNTGSGVDLVGRWNSRISSTTAKDERIAELEAALRPFAEFAVMNVPSEIVVTQGSWMAKRQLKMKDCQAARQALSKPKGEEA